MPPEIPNESKKETASPVDRQAGVPVRQPLEHLASGAQATSTRDRAYADSVLGTVDLLNSARLNACEIFKDADGHSKEVPLNSKLTAGDHTVRFSDGREFVVHVPATDGQKQLPVMFVFSGSAHNQYNIRDFIPESGMNRFADAEARKFIAVYPMPLKHMLGTGSDKTAYAWNVLDPRGGVLIDRRDSRHAGYDDLEFVKNIANVLPKVANVDSTHKDWAAIGFSQGGVFLNYLASKVCNLFPTMGLVGTTMQSDYKYNIQSGNAENVVIVNLRADKTVLPFKDSASRKYRYEALLHAIMPKSRFEKLNDLAAISNLKSDPSLQMSFYEKRLGPHSSETIAFNTPLASQEKDSQRIFRPTDPHSSRQVAVIDLPTAKHSYPEADPSGARTNAAEKYTEFDTDKQIVDLWLNYINRLKKDHGS
jgi:poly(3-hydroxybutyrate) depolymerase